MFTRAKESIQAFPCKCAHSKLWPGRTGANEFSTEIRVFESGERFEVVAQYPKATLLRDDRGAVFYHCQTCPEQFTLQVEYIGYD